MARKRKRLVVTVTERWTFVFDHEGDAPGTTADSPAPVPPSSLLEADPSVLLVKGADTVASPHNRTPADIITTGDDDAV